MATSEQIKALIKSHSEGDEGRFYSVAMQVAAHAAQKGHSKLADELRKLIDNAKSTKQQSPHPKIRQICRPKGELTELLSVTYPNERQSSLVLPDRNLARLQKIILEHRQKAKLEEHGLSARKKILLYGPPGTGKTLTASALAGELHFPLFTIMFDGLITKYMGETAAKLRVIFEQAKQVRGVYFFDEVDAIGGNRNAQNDVGEIRRVLNSFLLLLEQFDSDSLVLAATNNMDLLDKALFRRFDDVIEYELPNKEQCVAILKNRLLYSKVNEIDWSELGELCRNLGLSYAEITKSCDDALKSVVLDEKTPQVTMNLIEQCIQDRYSIK